MKGRKNRRKLYQQTMSLLIEESKIRLTVHKDCLCYIICVVTSNDMVDRQNMGSSIEGLPPENSAIGT